MKQEDLALFTFYVISSIVGILFGIYRIYTAKEKDQIQEGYLTILGSLTPGIMIITSIAIACLIGYICILPLNLIYKIKKL